VFFFSKVRFDIEVVGGGPAVAAVNGFVAMFGTCEESRVAQFVLECNLKAPNQFSRRIIPR
jgi:hypothetical protein